MGLFSDIIEDNAERSGRYFASNIIFPSNMDYKCDPPTYEKQIPGEKCPFCYKSFLELNTHFQDEHGQEHCYIRLNGSIIREIGWAENGITSIELGLLGYDQVEVQIFGGNFTHSFNTQINLDILPFLPLNFEGEIKIKIKPSQSLSKEFLIYSKSLPEFRRNDLDDLIVELHKELDESNYPLNFRMWRAKFKKISNINDTEKRYFDGFYEYALGSDLERKDKYKEAKQHFEDAFGLLSPFSTTLAQTAIRLLGLKMNCFAFFEGCSQRSPFASADAFFNKGTDPNGVNFPRAKHSEIGIFIDRFSNLFLDSLIGFYSTTDEQFPILLDALQRDSLSREKNNEDKLYLLNARYYRHKGEKTKAMEEYSYLQHHPIFGKEANSFIECQTKIK